MVKNMYKYFFNFKNMTPKAFKNSLIPILVIINIKADYLYLLLVQLKISKNPEFFISMYNRNNVKL